MIEATIIWNPVRTDFLPRALDTLYKFTDMTNWRVIVIDQTKNGFDYNDKRVHLWLKPHRNLGFAKSMNEGVIHGMRWNSKYIICSNDDIEFMDSRWWGGVLDTFAMNPERIYAVNPESPRIPLWGYGRPHGEFIDLLKYKTEYTKEDYDYLLAGNFEKWQEKGELNSPVELPKTFPLHHNGITDAIATWCTVFTKECFEKHGLWEERFYPGGAEDYDYNGRVYRYGGRMVGSTKSYVWHWWGFSKDKQSELNADIDPKLRWSNLDGLWPAEKNNGKKFDPWGKFVDKDGVTQPMYREEKIGIIDI